MHVLREKGQSASAIARQLHVTEGTVRYHVRRAAEGATDGRSRQVHRTAAFAESVEACVTRSQPQGRPPNVKEVYDHLVEAHGYAASYTSVLRFMRARSGAPRIRTSRGVETPPGAQTQTE